MIRKYLTHAKPWLKVILFLSGLTVVWYLAGLIGSKFPGQLSSLAFGTFGCAGGVLMLWLFDKIDMIRPGRGTLLKFLIGLLIGLLAFAAIFVPLMIFTCLTIKITNVLNIWQALATSAPILSLALMEEIGFRSYPQFTLQKAYGEWVSILIMAFVFGCYHVLYGWNPLVAFTGPLVWALLFGLAAIRSNGIAVPTGIHFALNVLQNLCGLKGNKSTHLFELGYTPGASPAAIAGVQNTGWLLQGLLFIALIVLNYYLLPRRQQTKN